MNTGQGPMVLPPSVVHGHSGGLIRHFSKLVEMGRLLGTIPLTFFLEPSCNYTLNHTRLPDVFHLPFCPPTSRYEFTNFPSMEALKEPSQSPDASTKTCVHGTNSQSSSMRSQIRLRASIRAGGVPFRSSGCI